MIAVLALAAFAGKWDGQDPNIEARLVVDSTVEDLLAATSDTHVLELLPDRCVSELTLGEPTSGYGAPFRVRYHAGSWTRLVEARVAEVGHRHVDLEHVGRFGFTTRFGLVPVDDGIEVTMTTFLDPPPWPFKRAFYTKVRPAWASCHADLLTALAGSVPAPAAPVDERAASGQSEPAEAPMDGEDP